MSMSVMDVASYMGVTESMVRRWAKERLLIPVDAKATEPVFEETAVEKYKAIYDRLNKPKR